MVEFDPRWPDDFTWLARQIADALGTRALIIEHIGSTSVPGLAAKPVIDIDLTVAVPADEGTWLPPLEAAGFDLVIREPWWYEHRVVVFEVPRCNVHVFGPESPEPVRHRIFRDWLRQHPQDRALYSAAKVAAAAGSNAAGEHVMEYNARKQLVVRAIYDRAFRAAGLL
ncbi:GrpB family protein [Allobranchiibius sp. CTAmp26]|uniref:GrpB family protein n=1 Tax=Allobranchiibius sp. CTAmp26 TaxID=2815214 RepID=UPI0027DC9933|nr:GrpB family protein [Allobranchiibius sp. CTAmp26]